MTEALYVCLNRVQYKLSNCSTLMSLQIDVYLIDYAFKTLEYNSVALEWETEVSVWIPCILNLIGLMRKLINMASNLFIEI